MIIAAIPKNKREFVRIELDTFRGHNLFSLRVWAKTEDAEAVPTRKGVTIAVALLPDIIAALQAAEAEARKTDMLKGGKHA